MEANTPEFFAELYAKGSYDELIEKGELFLEKEDSSDVRQYLVLAYQTKGDFLKALKHSQLIAEQSSDEIDWFSYAVNAIKTKQIDLGLEAFEKALRLNKEHAPQKEKADVWRSEAWMCYRIVGALFVEGAYEKAFQWLTVLKNVYAQYKITDTTFLIIRWVPNFEQFIEAASKILPHQTKADALKRLDDLYPEVDEEGQQAIEELKKQYILS